MVGPQGPLLPWAAPHARQIIGGLGQKTPSVSAQTHGRPFATPDDADH
jgi:hypothetical protein